MKFIDRGRVALEIPVLGCATGVGCDVIQLDGIDARRISRELDTPDGMERLKFWWQNQIQCRFNYIQK